MGGGLPQPENSNEMVGFADAAEGNTQSLRHSRTTLHRREMALAFMLTATTGEQMVQSSGVTHLLCNRTSNFRLRDKPTYDH
jgi:hypothetical protein